MWHARRGRYNAPPVRRRLFTLASALSLLICSATIGLWVHSYWTPDCWRASLYRSYECVSYWGLLRLSAATQFSFTRTIAWPDPTTQPGGSLAVHSEQRSVPAAGEWQVAHSTLAPPPYGRPFAFVRGQRWLGVASGDPFSWFGHGTTISYVQFPHWCLAGLFLPLPLASAAQRARRYIRLLRGHCLRCGYELRPMQDRCPECGTPAQTTRAAP